MAQKKKRRRLTNSVVAERFRRFVEPIGTKEAARRLGVSARTVRRWKQTGKIPEARWSQVAKLRPTKKRKSPIRRDELPKVRRKQKKYETDRHVGRRFIVPFNVMLPFRDFGRALDRAHSEWKRAVDESGLPFGNCRFHILSQGYWYPLELSETGQDHGEGGLTEQWVSTYVTDTQSSMQLEAIEDAMDTISEDVAEAQVQAFIVELVITLWESRPIDPDSSS